MQKKCNWSTVCGLATFLVLVLAGSAWAQEKEIKGLIVGRDGPNVMIRLEDATPNVTVTVTLDDSTKVQAIKGKLGLRKSDMGFTALIPGLPVEVKAEESNGQLVAKSVKFKASALKTANMIQAGLQPAQKDLEAAQKDIQGNKDAIAKTQADQEALEKRFGDLADYDVKGSVSVYFAVNSAKIDEKGKADVKALMDQAKQIKSYLIQVAGYTDSSGNADYNQELSDRRAAAVTAYIQQSCGVPLYRVLAPAAMGMADPASSNETAAGKAANRRVEVKIIVNRGVAGQ